MKERGSAALQQLREKQPALFWQHFTVHSLLVCQWWRDVARPSVLYLPTLTDTQLRYTDIALVIDYRPGNWLLIAPSLLVLFVSEGNCTVWTSFSRGCCFRSKSHLGMEDLAPKNTCKGVNGQPKTDESSSAAAHSVDSCCRSCLKSMKLRIPVDYKNEATQFLKLAGPVVRLCLWLNHFHIYW